MLLERIRAALADRTDVAEKRMVGGRSFMVDGRLCCGVVGEDLMVRLADNDYQRGLGEPFVRPMTLGGKPLKRCLLVSRAGIETDEQLGRWLSLALKPPGPGAR